MSLVNAGCSLQSSMVRNRYGRNGCPSNVRRGMQCHTCKAWWHFKCTGLQDDQLLSKALTDANTKNAAIWTKVDKELSSLNEYLALSTPGPLAAKKGIQLSDAAIKTATASLVDRRGGKRTLGLLVTLSSPSAVRKILGRAVSVQKANPTIKHLSEDRSLDARKLGHSNFREGVRKGLPDGASSADPKHDKGAAMNSTPKLQLSWIGSDERSQVAKPTGKPTTCADVDIGECCEDRTTTEAVKLSISSSTLSKVASLIVDTVVAQDHDSQSLKPDHGEPDSPSYTHLATLIAGDSDVHKGAEERRLQPNKPYTIRQIRKLLAGLKAQSSAKTSLMGATPNNYLLLPPSAQSLTEAPFRPNRAKMPKKPNRRKIAP
ncbi:hypothetical protein CLF_112837 [Clonorchis sinensis]|uniref:Uncharacterized protein n=1 Tax=Clonorchis sinensis TaxID=79923 RepID=G7YX39_CLOSI|nr:hypothetical protein CLF_112837 [Clonorchis sinensis]